MLLRITVRSRRTRQKTKQPISSVRKSFGIPYLFSWPSRCISQWTVTKTCRQRPRANRDLSRNVDYDGLGCVFGLNGVTGIIQKYFGRMGNCYANQIQNILQNYLLGIFNFDFWKYCGGSTMATYCLLQRRHADLIRGLRRGRADLGFCAWLELRCPLLACTSAGVFKKISCRRSRSCGSRPFGDVPHKIQHEFFRGGCSGGDGIDGQS